MKIITTDTGKYKTKSIMGNKKLSFMTKFQEIDSVVYSKNTDSYHISWEYKNYLLGEGLVDFDTTKQKLQNKLAAYISCAKFLENEDTDEIGLVVLCPISTFAHKQYREEFRQYIYDSGLIDFELDGERRYLILKDVLVYSEACAIAFSNLDKFENKITGVIDIGGLNCNGVIMNNMTPIKGSEFTINAGGYLIMEKIKKELNKELKVNIQDYQMDSIIKQGFYNYEPAISKEIIHSVISDHFTDIIQNMKANNWDVKGLDIIVTGGGSLLLGEDNIKKYIPRIQLSNNPVWDNCIGGQIAGEMIYEEE